MNRREVKRRLAEERKSLLLNENSPFAVIEAYKALRTNIMFSLPGTDCKCIAVTSSARAEGKSTNCANLAISFAQIGKKVLLIDADMRLSTAASMLGVRSKPGLSNLLAEGAKFNEVWVRDKEHGIDIIPAGNVPPDPTRLLESKQMEGLLYALRKHYQYIFIDLPPANTVTDALILTKCVDGYLLLVKHNSTEHRAVAEMISRFQRVNGSILGFLYTDAGIENKGYYQKYGYGSRK